MTRILTLGRQPSRVAPVEFRDAVELFARSIGCHGDLVWVDHANCWQVRLSLGENDPRRRDGSEWETHELQQFVHPDPNNPAYPRHDRSLLDKLPRHPSSNRLMPAYVAYELGDLGVGGLTEWLQRTSLVTGRGEIKSPMQALQKTVGDQRASLERARKDAKQLARDKAIATRRRVLKIPFLPVGIEKWKGVAYRFKTDRGEYAMGRRNADMPRRPRRRRWQPSRNRSARR